MADEADTAARLSDLALNPIRALSARDAKQVTSDLKDWIKAVPRLASLLAEGSVVRDFTISAFTLSRIDARFSSLVVSSATRT